MAMAGATNGGGGGNKVVSLRLQYYCVLAAVVVAVIVLSLAFVSPSAMGGAVHQNLGAAVGAAAAVGGERVGDAVAAAEREPPVVLFNFGDSNSDTGGVAAAGGIRIMPPEGRTYFHHPTGRLSDGRVIIDFICRGIMDISAEPYPLRIRNHPSSQTLSGPDSDSPENQFRRESGAIQERIRSWSSAKQALNLPATWFCCVV